MALKNQTGLSHGITGKWIDFDSLSNEEIYSWLDAEFERNPNSARAHALIEEETRRGGLEKRFAILANPKIFADEEFIRRVHYRKARANDKYCGRCSFNMGSHASRRFCCWWCEIVGFVLGPKE